MAAKQAVANERYECGIAEWLLDRAIYELHRFWRVYWWVLRAHVAAKHFIPRSCLEDPPEEWLRVMLGNDR
jgi:hypothetical protein